VTEAAVDSQVGAVVLVEPFGAGGGVDVVARPLAAELAEILKARLTIARVRGRLRRLRSSPALVQTVARF
jgi:tripartite-type tricarboxylate transporter receptor subunit TctC